MAVHRTENLTPNAPTTPIRWGMESNHRTQTCPLLVSPSENPGPPQGGRPASVQALETSVTPSPIEGVDPVPAWIQTRVQHVIHRRWMTTRRRLFEAFHRSGCDRLGRRAEKLGMCCASPLAYKSEGGETRTQIMRCRDRLCPMCSIKRSETLADQLVAGISKMDDPRHLVLTAPATPAPLDHQVADLRKAFRALRRSPVWKGTQRGGVYSIEVTRNEKTGLWHPHLHVVMDGCYIGHESARDEWREALRTTGCWAEMPAAAACVIWIERVGSRRRIGDYIGKYVAKPAEIDRWPEDALVEYAEAMHGARLVHAFGNLHGVKLRDDDEPNEPMAPGRMVSVLGVIRRARWGCPMTIAVCNASTSHGHRWGEWAAIDTPAGYGSVELGLRANESLWWQLVEAIDRDDDGAVRAIREGWIPPPPKPPDPWF